MKIQILTALQIVLILITLSAVAYFVIQLIPKQSCTPQIIKYNACYDSSSNSIFLEVNSENQAVLSISSNNKVLTISHAPKNKKESKYLFKSEQNPEKLMITSSSQNACNTTDAVILTECSNAEIDISLQLSLGSLSKLNLTSNTTKSDIMSKTLVNSSGFEACTSDWVCENWEECISGIQRRDCIDKNNCMNADIPDFTRKCNECKEDWQCEWSECINNYTTPECTDLNKCSTEFSKPGKLKCQNKACTPEISCTSWAECLVDVNIGSLSDINSIKSKRTRLCTDKNNCISPVQESEECSIKSDIYTELINLCGKEYIEIHDNLNKNILARLYYNKEKLDILFTGNKESYCEI